MSDQAIDAVMNYLAELTQEIKSIKAVMATKEDLAAMATKADIANMATKDDLAGMATKADIANMATKEDLAAMATKADIANMATKEDIRQIRAELAQETDSLRAAMATKADIANMATKDDLAGMATKADIAAIRAELANETASLRANMATKADISELRQAVARIEVEHGQKIGALFDAFELRGDEIRQLREHMDARFDALAADISLLVKKSFQHDNEIRDLRRAK